jgi:D-beta-D-heptose 7-phosphate kinase/D-beta-D-heptose 1-phosphate adenosyltransferase
MSNLARFLPRMRGRVLAVAGDFMLDHFIWGRAARVSAEAPVPVVETERETFAPGGAGNVAANLTALGARVSAFGVVGRDWAGRLLLRDLQRRGVECSRLRPVSDRPTTRKLRIIETARKHQVARADHESARPVDDRLGTRMLFARFEAVILSDYDKGMITPEFLARTLPSLRRRGTPVFLDPRPRNAAAYRPLTVMTPNRAEAEQMVGFPIRDRAALQRAALRLLEMIEGQAVLITLGEEGMALQVRGERLRMIPTQSREVYDVTGAGDTVIATLALACAAGASYLEAATLANYAAGIVVGHVGTAVPSLAELRSALLRRA